MAADHAATLSLQRPAYLRGHRHPAQTSRRADPIRPMGTEAFSAPLTKPIRCADLPDATTHLHRMARGPDGPGLWEGPVLPGVAGERVVRVVVDNRAAIENVGAVQPAAGADVLASLGHRLVRPRPLSLDRAQRLAAGVVRRRFADEDVLVLLAVELVLAGAADEDVASATAEDSVVPGATHQDISRRAAGDVVVPGFAIHLHGDVRVARDAHPVV